MEVLRFLQALLAERISIRDLTLIIEAIGEAVDWTQNTVVITEHVRSRLARQISNASTSEAGFIPMVTLSQEWEQAFGEALTGQGDQRQLAMAPSELQRFIQRLREVFEQQAMHGHLPVLVTTPAIRPYVRSIVERFRPATSADLDLADLLQPTAGSAAAAPWLSALAEHHDIRHPLRSRLVQAACGMAAGEPAAVLSHVLHGLFQFAPLPTASPVPYLLVGPPGAGKTASVAKLAARAVLAQGKVAVVSADVGRAGGIGQLEALTGPLGLEVGSAPDGATLRRLVGAVEADLLLIDSPGLNPFKPADLGRVSALIEASGAETILVLPAGLAALDCADIAHTYATLGVKRLLATKLDAARRLGGLLAAADAGLAFTEAGIGPTIGRGLSPLGAAGLARLLLHTQKAGTATPVPGGSNAHG